MGSFVSALRCPRCGARHDHRPLRNLCDCGTPLLVDYDLDAVRAAVDPRDLATREPTMWRYRELLPVEDPGRIVSLGEGLTPLLERPALAHRVGVAGLWVKDEGTNPTGTFKARGAASGTTAALERGVRHVALPTAGNAGGAWAAYGAAAGIGVHVAMPRDAPAANRLECLQFGAEVVEVGGLITDAGRVVRDWVADRGWFDVSTLREPYRIEGKKTLGLEIAEQLGWRFPDVIVYPAGGGVGLIGIDRAVRQLLELGWVRDPPPRLVVVQAEGCAPLVRAFDRGLEESEPWPDADTVAAGLRVPKALGDFLVLRALRETGGTAVAVSDREILSAMLALGEVGVSACPEGAATMAALGPLRRSGWLRAGDRVVLVNTGTSLKYPEAVAEALALHTRRA